MGQISNIDLIKSYFVNFKLIQMILEKEWRIFFEDLDYEAKQFLKNLNSETNLNIEKKTSLLIIQKLVVRMNILLIHLGRDY